MIERLSAFDKLSKDDECLIDAHTHSGVDHMNIIKGRYPFTQSIIDLTQKLRLVNIDHAVTFPCASSMYYFDFSCFANEKVKLIPHSNSAESFPYELANKQLFYEVSLFGENIIFPFAAVFPRIKEEEQISYLETVSSLDRIFGLKLHTLATHSKATDLANSKILDYAEKHSLPILFHTGPDKFSGAENVLELARQYPKIRFAMAHAVRFEKVIYDEMVTGRYSNVFIDVSPLISLCNITKVDISSGSDSKLNIDYEDPRNVVVKLLSILPKNIIWGTDEPWTTITDDRKDGILPKVVYADEAQLLHSLPKNLKLTLANTNTKKFLFGK